MIRYDMILGTKCGEGWQELEPADEGEWVRYEDAAADHAQEVQKLEQQLEAQRVEVESQKQHLENGEEMYIAMRGRCAGVEADLFRCQEEYEKLERDNHTLRAQVERINAVDENRRKQLRGNHPWNPAVWPDRLDCLAWRETDSEEIELLMYNNALCDPITVSRTTKAFLESAQLESSELRLKGLAAINQSAGEEIRELREQVEQTARELAFVKDAPAAELPRLVSCAIIIRDGKVLLEKRAPAGIEGLDNHWDLPGGKVEAGETVLTCAVREIKEELNIDVEPISICSNPLPSTWIYPNRGPRHWCLVGIVCNIVQGEPVTHDLLQWFSIDELPESLLEADRILIGQYLESVDQLERQQRAVTDEAAAFRFMIENGWHCIATSDALKAVRVSRSTEQPKEPTK